MNFLPDLSHLPLGVVLWYALAFLAALTVIVFIHEYGHFKVARLCGVKVETFSVGFGREIFGFNDRYGTRWKLGWLPLGGFVKFEGDMNAASMPGEEAVQTPTPGNFHVKPLWQRAAVVSAGPIANFILAIVIFAAAALFVGVPFAEPRIDEITPGSAAETAGLKKGDIVKEIAGEKIESFTGVTEAVRFRAGETVVIIVDRGGETLSLTAVIGSRDEKNWWAGDIRTGFLGVGHDGSIDGRIEKQSIAGAIAHGVERVGFIVDVTFRIVGKMFLGTESPKQLGGVLSMANAAGEAASAGILPYVALIGFLSVSIGLINLFPIPMLDGGHLVFYAIEAIRRKPLGAQAQEWSYKVGFAVVMGLLLLGNGNDLVLRVLPKFFGDGAAP